MKKFLPLSLLAFVPAFAFAAADAFTVMIQIQRILNYVIPILITIAVIYFVWGVIQYTMSSDEEAKKGARGKIIQGLIGLFVIVSFWGIVNLITNTLDVGSARIGPGTGQSLPCIPNPSLGISCP